MNNIIKTRIERDQAVIALAAIIKARTNIFELVDAIDAARVLLNVLYEEKDPLAVCPTCHGRGATAITGEGKEVHYCNCEETTT